jgi:hypothetical protein
LLNDNAIPGIEYRMTKFSLAISTDSADGETLMMWPKKFLRVGAVVDGGI